MSAASFCLIKASQKIIIALMEWLNRILNRFEKKPRRIFLDYASATPVLKEVGQEMVKYFSRNFYNPSAIYQEALEVKKEVEDYRSRVAGLVGAGKQEIVFTAGGTESVNLAILGAFEEYSKTAKGKPHIIISAIEHPAVVRAAEEVVRRGGEMSVVEVDEEGVVSIESLKKLLKKNTFLVSITLANSEIGTVEPVAKIGRIIKEERKARGAGYPLLHTDASAAPGFLEVKLEALQCDMLTLDGSKIYGPKGVGILATRRGVKLHPIIFGGSQERGRRPGTTNPAMIAGIARALEIAARDRESEAKRLESMRQKFIEKVIRALPHAIINGSSDAHLPNIVSISIPNTLSEFLLLKLDKEGVLVSVGTACSFDEKVSGSPIIRAIGKPELSESTLRFSFGRGTSEKELKIATEIFCREARNLIK